MDEQEVTRIQRAIMEVLRERGGKATEAELKAAVEQRLNIKFED